MPARFLSGLSVNRSVNSRLPLAFFQLVESRLVFAPRSVYTIQVYSTFSLRVRFSRIEKRLEQSSSCFAQAVRALICRLACRSFLIPMRPSTSLAHSASEVRHLRLRNAIGGESTRDEGETRRSRRSRCGAGRIARRDTHTRVRRGTCTF